MTHPANEGFTDNWGYLKTELTWLDRMLMMALARYRQEKKSVDRIAQSPADQASSHWWKGVVSLDGNIAYDEHRPSAPINGHRSTKPGDSSTGGQSAQPQPQPQAKLGYQQQLDLRIQASKRNGVTLALPWLCDRLKLSLFEKNLILMALAPEVNRRFARLYRYLQSHDDHLVSDLPSVELVLRLLCRNDQEWRRARQQLNPDAALMTHNLVLLLYQSHDPFLNATIRLADELVDCLLAEDPDPNALEALLTVDEPSGVDPHQWPAPHLLPVNFSNQLSGDTANPTRLTHPDSTDNITLQTDALATDEETDGLDDHGIRPEAETDGIVDVNHDADDSSENGDGEDGPTTQGLDRTKGSPIGHDSTDDQWAPTWGDLVLPAPLHQSLRHLTQRFRLHKTVNQFWSEQSPKFAAQPPGLVLLFAGPKGTGKTLAANILAHDIADSLTCVHLAEIMQADYPMVMDEVEAACPSVVLIQAAEQWLRSSASVPSARLSQFFAQRRRHPGLTIFSVERVESVAQGWRQQIHPIFHFPLPDATARQILWRQAFPPKLKLGRTIDWDALSQIELSGGVIGAIAHDAIVRMVADNAKTLKLQYLLEALQWHHVPSRQIKLLQNAARPSRSRPKNRRSDPKATTAATADSKAKSKAKAKSKSKDKPKTAKSDGAALSAATIPPAHSATTLESSQLPGVPGEAAPSSGAQPAPALAQPPTQVKRGQNQPTDVVTADHHADANV
ncbi:MAG: AAA family ATPase [Leptolyngbyaceae bacterium]|nr:AAA family ATPase [Leptolyngbyaceae bacterium]